MTKKQTTEEKIREEDTAEETVGPDEGAFQEFVHHQRTAIEELGKAVESLFPKEFRSHTKNAGQAFIDSFRALFEAAKEDFEHMMKRREEEGEDKPAESSTKVKVEIE